MDEIKILEDIKKQKEINIKLIIFISLFVFVIYGMGLIKSIYLNGPFEFTENAFRIIFSLILAIMGILSCLLAYNSRKKDELFIISLMYTIFFIDILHANTTGYMISSKDGYYAIITSFLRICILYISISNFTKLKELILTNKTLSFICSSIIATISIYIEYNYLLPYSNHILDIYKYYKILLGIVYLLIAIKYFKKSLNLNEYVYSVIGSSAILLSIKSIYDFYQVINRSEELSLIGYSIVLIGFIIFIAGLFIEVNQATNKNKILDEKINLFVKIIDENKHSSIVICDEDYKIVYKNKKATESLNNNYINLSSIELGDKFDIVKICEGISSIDSIESIEKQLLKKGCYIKDVYSNNNNIIYDLSVHLHKISKDKYKVIIIRDVSEKYKLEKALLEYETIKEQERMKNEFFANISHELKTPLNIIYSTNQLLDSSIYKSDFIDIYLKYSKSLNINCKRMLRLIDNIVDMAKIDVEFKTPNYNNYNIVSIVEEMTMSVLNYAKVKGIELIFDTDIEELIIKFDLDMLERIVLNLLSNAIKFSNEGSSIFVNIVSNNEWVEIKVKDQGIGIDKEMQERIFERFVQGDKSIRRKKEGSGIGLSLTKTLVELMDGKILLESDGQNGSQFTVLLPNKTTESSLAFNNEIYKIDVQRVQTELSDIYELYEDAY